MSKKFLDLTGVRVNRLTVLRRVENVGRQPAWLCQCDCGAPKRVLGTHLRAGDVIDCGCGRSARQAKSRQTHGMTDSAEFRTWSGMKSRCSNPNGKYWAMYGGRGIAVCDRWLESFENFYADMGPRPAGTTLDRIDNDKGYSPDNCRWATRKDQQNNRRANVIVTLDGVSKTLAQWAEYYGVPYPVVKDRRSKGVSGAALFAPLGRRKYKTLYTHNGVSLTITEWAERLGSPYITVWQRIHLANKNPDGSDKD